MNHWLVKTEPGTYSWAQLQKEGRTAWTGVRNFQARNNLRAMKKGDPVLVYHSGDEKQVVGLAEACCAAYPDPTAKDGDWSCVDLAAVKSLPKAVTLAVVKKEKALQQMLLVRNSRISVMPVTPAEFNRVMELAQ
jgi:predicted RNA-binding protein with PUA-like domain